jgi:hypothetical protein
MPIYSYISKLGISSSNPVDTRYDFRSCSLGLQEEFVDGNGLRGTRSPSIERVRQGIRRVTGQIRMQPNAAEWAGLLPWILGANPSGTTYALADRLQKRYVTVDLSDDTDGKVMTYDNCAVSRARIIGRTGQPIDLELEIVGVDEAVDNAGTFPALNIDTTTGPFIFPDSSGAIVINGVAVGAPEFTIEIDNQLDTERFFNSLTLSPAFQAMGRNISVSTRVPYSDAEALYGTGAGGVPVVWTLTNGSVSLAWSLVKVAFPRRQIEVPERGEELLRLEGKAYMSGSTRELVVTCDSTV